MVKAQLQDPDAPFDAAIIPVIKHAYDHDLHAVLKTLLDQDFVVVADLFNRITGIVTTADVVGKYSNLSMPFLPVGELDQRLRQIMETFELEVLSKLCSDPDGPGLTSYDDMTMGDYQSVLENPGCWEQLGWKLDRGTFVKHLDELRKVRNDIAHLNPDGVSEATVDKLRHMLDVIRTSGPAVVS